MGFWGFIWNNKKDNYKALWLFIVFFLFYVVNNYPFIEYMKHNTAGLVGHNPFYGAPFMLNLFNFDPSMYYGSSNTSIVHPFLNFLTGPFTFIANHSLGNLFFLLIQSVINALSVVMIYYYLRNMGRESDTFPLLFAAFFGVSSYNLFTVLVPDSYPYAQFIIILSVLYLQYYRVYAKNGLLSNASLALANFAVTSTNVVPFLGAVFFNIVRNDKKTVHKFIRILLYFLLMVIAVTLLQFLLFDGHSWVNNWFRSLSHSGFSYVSVFSFSQHWKAIYMLIVSPILTPDIALIDPGIVAFATDLMRPYPFYVHVIGLTIIVLSVLGFIRGKKSRESWVLATPILFAICLHLIVGYGLAAFKYDMYLYAGHYLFAFFLLSASFVMQIRHGFMRKVWIGIILVFIIVTLSNNIIKHIQTLTYIEKSYVELNVSNTGKK